MYSQQQLLLAQQQPMKRCFKLFVSPDANALQVLRYLNQTILKINTMGVYFTCVKIKPAMMTPTVRQSLAQQGITRLPAVLTDDRKVWMGANAIISKIQENIGKMDQLMGYDNPEGQNVNIDRLQTPSMDDVYHEELKHLKKEGDRFVFEDDEDDNMAGGQIDYRKEMEKLENRRQETLGVKAALKGGGTLEEKLAKIGNMNLDDNVRMPTNGNGNGNRRQQPKNNNDNVPKGLVNINTESFDKDDFDIMAKLGGGEACGLEKYGDDTGDDEEMYRRQAMRDVN